MEAEGCSEDLNGEVDTELAEWQNSEGCSSVALSLVGGW